MKEIKVIELFAGVGGFRLGLSKSNGNFKTIISNQWEPNKSFQYQYAFKALEKNFNSEEGKIVNKNISEYRDEIPKNIDLLVAGFPCQDYSVASTKAKGIEGKKGVLWWDISYILKNKRPKMILLENVDRILKSPTKNKGRDFAIILKNLDTIGYNVEWKVINAAEYGEVQKRKRIFIFAWLKKSEIYKEKNFFYYKKNIEIINEKTFFQKEFPSKVRVNEKKHLLFFDIKKFNNEFSIMEEWKSEQFFNDGFMYNGKCKSYKTTSVYNGNFKKLEDILEKEYDDNLLLTEEQILKVKFLKGQKKILRTTKDGFEYFYTEGKMSTFENIKKPSRTILTSEGTINRSSHFIKVADNKYRKISAIEAERLNGFDDNWTAEVMPNRMRYFCMGNALVVNLITKMGNEISKIVNESESK